MKRVIFIFSCVFFSFILFAQSGNTPPARDQLSPGAALLFKGVKTNLSVADKNDIFIKTKYVYSENGNKLLAHAPTEAGDTALRFDIKLLPTDMNRDGAEEVFIVAYINSDIGLDVYIKKKGSYVKSEVFYGDTPYFLKSKNLGYYDIDCGGFKYRFDGAGYKSFKGITGTKLKTMEAYSKDYTSHFSPS